MKPRAAIMTWACDSLSIMFSWLAAYGLRYGVFSIPAEVQDIGFALLLLVYPIQSFTLYSLGLYRGLWQFTSIPDLIRIGKAVFFSALLTVLLAFFMTRMEGVPRSVIVIDALLLGLFLAATRLAVRLSKDHRNRDLRTKQRVLIIGAGQSAEALVRDLKRDHGQGLWPVVIIDEALESGKELQGVRVVNNIERIPFLVQAFDVELILIALPKASASHMQRILSLCQATQKPVRITPSLTDVVAGRVAVDLLREVSIEDLLGRAPVPIDWQKIETMLSHHTVLVTGAGGSIGSELCRQVLRLKPKTLIAIDHCEYNLFKIAQEFHTEKDVEIKTVLADIKDLVFMQALLSAEKPEIIFHAAAYKHVPILEPQIREAVLNNILGTYYLAEAAIEAGVKKFILVSSDKAVNPKNVMGASKRAAELIGQAFNALNKTQFVAVRFGNVLGSTGSVVPIFKAQLAKGGPLTVTHEKMTRYFMTIPEASSLILQATHMGRGGEIFVLDMGEPVSIQFLAEQMIRLAGKVPGKDIGIEYVGLRPGEKLFEELFHESEDLKKTEHGKILQALLKGLSKTELDGYITRFKQACENMDGLALSTLLQQLVPEWERDE